MKRSTLPALALALALPLAAVQIAPLPEADAQTATVNVNSTEVRARLAAQAIEEISQAIKDGLRQEMATEWLADASVSYGEIAERLGFADVSSFYKAFRKWTGINPGHYRNLILAPARG